MSPPQRVDSNPVRTASARQIVWTVAGALLPGAIVMFGYLQSDTPIGLSEIGTAALAVLLPLAAAEKVRRGTVRAAEAETTPWRDAQDDLGRPLTPPDDDLKVLLRRNLAMNGWPERAKRQTPSGTRVGAAIDQARSMTVDDAAAYRAAAGPESKQPHERWEPTSDDWYGESAAAQDQRIAREHGPRAERVSRAAGPDPAQRPRRRHDYRGGPTDGGGR